MRRFLTVLEGPGKGSDKPLDKPYMLVGRSRVADVPIEGDDLLVSRRHLEVRIKDDAVFVKDISSKGSLLNGQRLKGEVSLNRGDVLDLGHTKLRYEEIDGAEVSSPSSPASDETQAAPEQDRTRLGATVPAPAGWGSDHTRSDGEKADATHAAFDDHTRMLNPAELPGWKSPVRKGPSSTRVVWLGLVVCAVLVTAAATYWSLNRRTPNSADATIQFKDSEFGFSIEYPPDWSKTQERPGMIGFGLGDEKSAEWVKLNIYFDKNPLYSSTGLTYGFS